MSSKSQLALLGLGVCLIGVFAAGCSSQKPQPAAQPAEKEVVADQQAKPETTDHGITPNPKTRKPKTDDLGTDNPKASEDRFAGLTLEELANDYSIKVRAYSKRYRAAPTVAEKREVFKTLPNVKQYWPRLIEMINENPGSDAGLEIVDWWYRRGGRREGSDIISRLLVKNYSQKKSIKKYVSRIAFHLPKDEAEETLRSLMDVNSFDTVKATATYELHQLLQRQAEELDAVAAKKVLAEVRTLRDLIFAKYPDGADVQGAKYTGLLAAVDFAANLKIGSPVPEIKGVDLDGVEFNLSDYDEKVRVISFWGDW